MEYINAGTIEPLEGRFVLYILGAIAVVPLVLDSTVSNIISYLLNLSPKGYVSIVCSLLTAYSYYQTCSYFENKYHNDLKNRVSEWKIQQKKWLSNKLHSEEVYTGTRNAGLGGFIGCLMIVGTQNKLYCRVTDYGWAYYLVCYVWFFLWVEIYAYTVHRLHHTPIIYKLLHKQHHRYVSPTPFAAYAMNPVEFLIFVVGPLSIIYVVPIHVVPFLLNLIYIGFHAIVDHSGIDYASDFPFQASVRFHDDHHRYFHANYGQSSVLLDWLLCTIHHSEPNKNDNREKSL